MIDCVKLLKDGRMADLYVLARFCYRVGEEILDDANYATIHNYLRKYNLMSDYTERSYDDDPIPYSLLEEFNLTNLIPDFSKWESDYDRAIEDEKSMSIKAIESYKESYDYFMAFKDFRKVMSIKVNGVNGKTLYTKEDGENLLTLKISKSRGRDTSESFNFTKGLSRIIPNSIDLDVNQLFIHGEAVVVSSAIGKLVSPTGVMPKLERMAALSMLRTNYADADYQYLRYKVFNCDGYSDSLSESLEFLKTKGFDVVPFVVIEPHEVPNDFEEFCAWLKDKLKYFHDICKEQDLAADGIVVDVDDVTFKGDINGQYSSKNIALKFEYWSHKYYKSKVVDLKIEQQGKKCSAVAIIEPCKTSDGAVARRVNLHSPAVMFSQRVLPGTEIYFKRNSEAINLLVYGKELRDLLGGVINDIGGGTS